MNVSVRHRRTLVVAVILLVAAVVSVSTLGLRLAANPAPAAAVSGAPATGSPTPVAAELSAPVAQSADAAGSPSPSPAASPSTSVAPSAPATGPADPSPSPSATSRRTPSPASTPAGPPLPALLGAIGDSYSQAYNLSAALPRDHPEHSWVVGTAQGDGVYSVLERLRALGARPAVVDAATSGRKMIDAPRQARAVVAAAAGLRAGAVAYVTFELGTNDLCDYPATDAAAFERDLDAALSILRSGLPRGSRILVLSIPDFDRFRVVAADYWTGRTAGGNACPPFLGTDGRISLGAARATLESYDTILERSCAAIDAGRGKAGSVYCRTNRSLLSESNFATADLSAYDHFHPSLSGQAKMAAAGWSAGFWASSKLP